MHTVKIHITGIVQGVGFRPFVANLARELGLTGTVQNTGGGVEIYISGTEETANTFLQRLSSDKPPMAHIAEIAIQPANSVFEDFKIIESEAKAGVVFVPVDLALCPECAAELADPDNRRYDYPFINCTQCGPRYTIIEALPYDRDKTTMDSFTMCPACRKEYDMPSDRRYHAQPNACAVCGPHVWLDVQTGDHREKISGTNAIKKAAALVNAGEIIAMRGLGGYHLICDATNDAAVIRLRELKGRPTKPFAVICDSKALLNAPAYIEKEIFSPAAPIVIFEWKEARKFHLSPYINPLNNEIGVMCAYTPLHKLLLKYTDTDCIVATSGNFRDEPIVADIEEAEKRLSSFTDYILHHNRPIKTRIDDSVAIYAASKLRLLRRGRGYAPFPVRLPVCQKEIIFAAGAHLKNCITITKDKYAFVSQYLGDLDSAETVDFYRQTYEQMCTLLNCTPERAVCDLHEGYFSTNFAKKLGIPLLRLQHHHAHMFAAMAEHGLTDNVLAVIMDGTGYGEDGAIWGGEFFSYVNGAITREAHIEYVGQTASDASVRHPSRMAQSWLMQAEEWGPYWMERMKMREDIALLNGNMLQHHISVLLTSSAGRLFESIGAMLLGIPTNEYEGHAAIALEALAKSADSEQATYPFAFNSTSIRLTDTVAAVAEEIRKGISPALIAARFHNTIARMIYEKILTLAEFHAIYNIVLSGGVFQNKLLLSQVYSHLTDKGFICHIPEMIPMNDGGISLGQAYWAQLVSH